MGKVTPFQFWGVAMGKVLGGLVGVITFYVVAIGLICGALLSETLGMSRLPSDDTYFKLFLENNGLNLLGDALSGFFAPITFLVVVFTLFIQHKQTKETVKEMRDQNALSKTIANANYRLALHEKRLSVYVRLQQCASQLISQGTIDDAARREIHQATEDAKFVFGDDVMDYTDRLMVRSFEIMRREFKRQRLSQKIDRGVATEEDTTAWNQVIDEIHSLENWFLENLTYGRLDEVFSPTLKLPENID